MSKGGKWGRLIIGENLGPVDLLKYKDNVLLPIADVDVPNGVSAHQVRLVLKAEGNMIVKDDDSVCALQTPSAQKTGVKIIFGKPVAFESGFAYSMVVDFDAEKSIVLQGNGGCLLKPVIKMKSTTRIGQGEIDNNDPSDDEDLTDGGDWNNGQDCGRSGWDGADESQSDAPAACDPTPSPAPTPLPTSSPRQPPDDFTPRTMSTFFGA